MKYSTDDGQTWNDYYISALDSMPLGSIILYAGDSTNVPAGWMICDGTSLSEEEYPALYDILGYTYGGSGTSFNLPNFKGKVPVGLDSTQTEFDTLGETGGEKTVQLTTDNLASNVISTSTTGSNADGYIMRGGYTASGTYNIGGIGAPHNNLQPYLVVNYIIKVEQLPPVLGDVLNSHSDSTVDTYSCDYSNKHYGGVVLYSGNTSSNVTLSDSASNYSYIEVYGQKSGCYGYVKIYNPNGKQFGLAIHNTYESNNIQQMFGRYTISGTTIIKDFEVYMNNNGAPVNSNVLEIVKVIGYK